MMRFTPAPTGLLVVGFVGFVGFATVGCTTSSSPPPPDVANGVVGAWQTAAPLPVARANHCSVAIDDWVLVIGGNRMESGGFVATDEIDAAQLAPDGTLGPWQVAGHTASAVTECNAAADGRTLYVIDGIYDVDADARQIWTAELDTTGHLGALVAMGSLPGGVIAISSEATVRDHALLLMDTLLPAEGDKTVTLHTPLAGALAWTTDEWSGVGFRSQAEYAFAAKFAYTLGGYHDPAVGAVIDTFVAPIAADGTIGAARPAPSLPAPIGWGEAAAVDDWLFVVGGRAQALGGGATTSVYAAEIAEDGSPSTWHPTTALPMARTNHDMVVVGDYLVVTGGAAGGPGDAMVLIAQVRFAADTAVR
jgi:hypothetical protein